MPQVQLVDGYDILVGEDLFLNTEQTCTPKIDNTEIILGLNHFSDPVVLRAGTVINKIAGLDIIDSPPVKRHNHRQQLKPVRESSIFRSHLSYSESSPEPGSSISILRLSGPITVMVTRIRRVGRISSIFSGHSITETPSP